MTSESSWSWSQGLAAGSSVSSVDRAILLDRHLAGERPAVELAAELGEKPGKSCQLGAMSDRLLEESDRFGVCVVPSPAARSKASVANSRISSYFLISQRARLLERLAGIDRVSARSRRRPDGRCRPGRP